MFNLTVDEAHTFYVGTQGWLVHNAGEPKKSMLGENGTQTPSKTLWKGTGKERIDVENPNPGQRPGQIHYQDNKGNKYLYNPETGKFDGAPKWINDQLENSNFKKGIDKDLKYLGVTC